MLIILPAVDTCHHLVSDIQIKFTIRVTIPPLPQLYSIFESSHSYNLYVSTVAASLSYNVSHLYLSQPWRAISLPGACDTVGITLLLRSFIYRYSLHCGVLYPYIFCVFCKANKLYDCLLYLLAIIYWHLWR